MTVGAPVTTSISGLAPNTLYHFRLVVSNATGTAFGADQTFTTARTAAPPPALKAPRISGLTLSPALFVAASHGAATASVRTGSTITYSDTVAATTVFTVERPTIGRLNGGSCAKTTKRNRSRKHCTRLIKIGQFNHADGAGTNRFHFTGRVGGRKLALAATSSSPSRTTRPEPDLRSRCAWWQSPLSSDRRGPDMPNPEVTPDASKAVGSHPRGRPRQQHPTLASRCRDSVSFVPGRDRRHLEHPPEVVDTRSQTCRTCRSRWPGSEGVATSTRLRRPGVQSGPADVATDALPHPCPSGTAPCNHVVHVLDGSAPPPQKGG